MPELPDVEQFRRYFDSTCLRRSIRTVRVKDSRILRGCTGPSLGRALHNRMFQCSLRRGKYLIVKTDGQWQVILHFGMTGSLRFSHPRERNSPSAVLTFHFADGSKLTYVSQRLLGHIRLTKQWQAEREIARLGPDPLDPRFTHEQVACRLRSRKGRMKTLLMNQTFLAGIGNLYSDEILFQTQMHPLQNASLLTESQVKHLYRAARRILGAAIARHADIPSLPRSYLLPHRAIGNPCPRCKSPFASLRLGGRAAIFCPRCQPLHR